MELYILRHAIAEDKTKAGPGADSLRRLTAEGTAKMKRVAKGMKEADLSFDLILSSPYVRAKQTAEIVAKEFRASKRLKLSAALAADSDPETLIDELNRDHQAKRRVLVVGHEPYLSRLISVLISGSQDAGIVLKKGGLCKLVVGELKYSRCASVEWLLTPGLARRIG